MALLRVIVRSSGNRYLTTINLNLDRCLPPGFRLEKVIARLGSLHVFTPRIKKLQNANFARAKYILNWKVLKFYTFC